MAGLTMHVARQLEAETGEQQRNPFIRFPDAKLALLWFWYRHSRALILPAQSVRAVLVAGNHGTVERDQRTYAALLVCFGDLVKGEMPDRHGDTPVFTDRAYRYMWELWVRERTQQSIAEREGIDERTIDRVVSRGIDVLTARLRRRGLLRGGGR